MQVLKEALQLGHLGHCGKCCTRPHRGYLRDCGRAFGAWRSLELVLKAARAQTVAVQCNSEDFYELGARHHGYREIDRTIESNRL
eukprot:4189764-Amphidinium_carterae.2